MNIHEYMTNPMKRGSSVLLLNTVRVSLDSQYDQLSERMSVKWYMLNNSYYVAHVKIPSAHYEKVFYDVLLQFDLSTADDSLVINQCDMKIFSNCPSFTYTYAYVYNERNCLIEWARSKYNRNILKKRPVNRNPDEILNYERSVYFACKYITSSGRNYISRIKSIAVTAKYHSHILSEISTNDEIEYACKNRGALKPENKNATSNKKENMASREPSARRSSNSNTKVVSSTKKTSNTKTTKKTKHTRSTNMRRK